MEIIQHNTTVFAQQFGELRLIRAKSRRTLKEDLRSYQHCHAPSRRTRGRKTPNSFKNRTWFFTDVTVHSWSRIVTSDRPTQNRSTHTVALIPNVTEHKIIHFIPPTELRPNPQVFAPPSLPTQTCLFISSVAQLHKQPNTFAFNNRMTADLKPSFPIWSSRMTLRKPPKHSGASPASESG